MLTHAQLWRAIDAVAVRKSVSLSALAKAAGLDPTIFNLSKRTSIDKATQERWPSMHTLLRLLAASGITLIEFAELAEATSARRTAPLIGFAKAGEQGVFDDAGFPVGQGWDEIDIAVGGGAYALEIVGDSMFPVYRDGDRLVVHPIVDPRRGDRLVIKTVESEVMVKEVDRVFPDRLILKSLNPNDPSLVLQRSAMAWISRILWASQ